VSPADLNRTLRSLAVVLALALLWTSVPEAAYGAGRASAGQKTNRRLSSPASRLNRPEGEPPFICGHLSFGGTFSHEQGNFGYGGSVIFRPPAAADFLDFLNDWNTGLVLQVDRFSLGNGGRLLSADLLFRRYLAERGGTGTSILPFVGGGFGATSAWPGTAGDAPGLKYWSLVLEAGQEWRFDRGWLLLAKGQLRLLRQDGVDWSTWSVMVGAGLPFPW
jgi:hypothetical protein